MPHLHRDWAQPLPHLHQDWARRGTSVRATEAVATAPVKRQKRSAELVRACARGAYARACARAGGCEATRPSTENPVAFGGARARWHRAGYTLVCTRRYRSFTHALLTIVREEGALAMFPGVVCFVVAHDVASVARSLYGLHVACCRYHVVYPPYASAGFGNAC